MPNMERMKAEGCNRDSDMSSNNEEYDPDKDAQFEEDVKEEYTSSPSDSSDSYSDYSDMDSDDEKMKAEHAQRRAEVEGKSKQKKKEVAKEGSWTPIVRHSYVEPLNIRASNTSMAARNESSTAMEDSDVEITGESSIEVDDKIR